GGESNNEIRLTGYLSNDNMLDDSDIPLLFNAYIPYLRKGDSTCTNMPGMIPEDITPGNYHLILKIDGTNLTAEHNEENNIISREIVVINSLVDIYFQAFIDSEFFITGISKSIDVFCKDVSGEINDSIIINAFISEYSDMNGSETLVFTDTIFYTEYQPLPMLIPEGVTEGHYYLHLHVVYASNKHERNKENNSISMPIGVFKNEMEISIDSFYVAENDIFLNEVFNYGLKISNGSANLIDSVYYSLYLSENKTYEPEEDILIQNGTHFITPFGQTLIESDVKVADTHEPGRYYVLGLASPQQLNNDINELMSVAFDSIWIKPDLSDLKIYSSTTNSDTLVPWNSFQCSLVIHNVGNRATNDYYYTQVYLSKDSIYDNNDLFLDSVASEATQAFSANTSIFNITIPSNNILEQAYLIYHLDKQNIIEEIDDTNNKFSQPVFINKAFIDLSVDSCIIPSDTLAPGASFELSIPVRNLGNVTASLNDVNIYLSSDSVLNKVEDTMLGTYLTQEILPGAEDTTKVDIQIPEGYPLGKTNVLINAEVSELDLGQVILHDTIAGNNTAIKTIIIEAEKHGLHPSWLKEDTLFAVQGQYTDTHFRVFNSGNTDVNNFKIKIYLSKDSLIDSSDDIYFDEAFTNMNIYSGKSYWDYLFFDAPNLEGNYYFILDVVTDFDSANDNLIFKPISFVKAIKEIGIKVYDYPDTLLPQEYFFGKLKVNNYGNTVLSDLNLNFYLSEDSILDSSDTFVNQLPIGYLPVEDSIYSNLYFVVPESNEPIKYLLVEGEPDISLVNENVSKNIAYYELIIDNPGLQTDPEYGNVTIQSFNLSYRLEENNAILTYELWKDTFIVVENLITEFFISSDTLNPPAQSVFVDSIGVWEGNVLTRIHTFSSDSIQKWNEKYIFLRIPDIKGDTLTTDNSSYLKVDFDITNLNELNSVTDNISIYPSPANIMINIVGRKAINEIKVYSLSGMLVQHHSKLDVEHFQLNLQHLNQGVYFMLIRCDDRWIDKLFIKK
ncbi:MAG: CARDB domain-containing protein, partial [Cyclobacteriaceae bacterium]